MVPQKTRLVVIPQKGRRQRGRMEHVMAIYLVISFIEALLSVLAFCLFFSLHGIADLPTRRPGV